MRGRTNCRMLLGHRVVKPRAPHSAATSGLRADRRFSTRCPNDITVGGGAAPPRPRGGAPPQRGGGAHPHVSLLSNCRRVVIRVVVGCQKQGLRLTHPVKGVFGQSRTVGILPGISDAGRIIPCPHLPGRHTSHKDPHSGHARSTHSPHTTWRPPAGVPGGPP